MSTAFEGLGQYGRFAFAILFVTLGPLKTIPVFYALTQDRPVRYLAELGVRAFVDASVLVALVFVGAEGALHGLGVWSPAVVVAAGVILFVTALRSITGFSLAELPPTKPEPVDQTASATPGWFGRPVLTPLTVPTIVTPAAVVAILFLLGCAGDSPTFRLSIFLLLGLMMLLNLTAMLLAKPIMRLIGLPLLQITGWVFAVLQAALAVQAVVAALRTLRVLP